MFGGIDIKKRQGSGFTSQRRRDQMVESLRTQGICHPEVLEVMRRVPRHLFLDEAIAVRAYDDTALPIGCGQTISQPFIVGRMTEIILGHKGLNGRPKKILEIGTGSGYQSAVLAPLVEKVVTVECIDELYRRASKTLTQLGTHNVSCYVVRSGQWGQPRHAPYDAIILTAATEHIPQALFEQLAPDGILLAPVGRTESVQILSAYTCPSSGAKDAFAVTEYESVRFVPLIS